MLPSRYAAAEEEEVLGRLRGRDGGVYALLFVVCLCVFFCLLTRKRLLAMVFCFVLEFCLLLFSCTIINNFIFFLKKKPFVLPFKRKVFF